MGHREDKQIHRVKRDRLDHILPKGYLDGFTDPFKRGQLSVFDRHKQQWFETGPAAVGARRGHYDYSLEAEADETADQAFAELEGSFPNVRKELVSSNFVGWEGQLDFLLRFAQMLRARSQLFRDQILALAKEQSIFRVEEVLQRHNQVDQDPFTTRLRVAQHVPAEVLLRNKTITDMRTEIAKGPARLAELHWCLRLTLDSGDPMITTDPAVISDGRSATLEEAFSDRETLIFFPLSWQACLIGSPSRFETGTDSFHPLDLKKLRALYLKSATHFVYSPRRLERHLMTIGP